MSERYVKIFSLPNNLYAESAPVLIKAGALLKDTERNRMLVQLKFKSITEKVITSLLVELRSVDESGNPGERSIEFCYDGIAVELDSEFGDKTPIFIKSNAITGICVAVKSVSFSDGSMWESSGDLWQSVKPRRKIEKLLTHPYELKAYKARFGDTALFVPEKFKGARICTCGKMNMGDAEACMMCGTNFASLSGISKAELYTEGEYLTAKELSSSKNAKDIIKAKAMLAELGSYRDSGELIALCDEKLANYAKKKNKHRKLVFSTAVCLLVLCIGVLGAFVGVSSSGNWLEYEKLDDGSGYAVTGAYFDGRDNYTVPETYLGLPVVAISDYAFSGCEELTGITLPSSVTTVGIGAFYSCTNLKSVELLGAVTVKESAFAECTSLKTVSFADSLRTLESYAFENCSSIEEITLPAGLEKIEFGAFEGCSSIKSMTLAFVGESKTNPYYGFGYIFGSLGYDSKDAYKIPTRIEEVTVLGGKIIKDAFRNYTGIKEISIKSGVESVGESAFDGCSSLRTVNIESGINTIGSLAFFNCMALREISVPDSVESIGSGAFAGCKSLKNVTLGEKLTSIAESTFSGCTSLESLESSALTAVGKKAFMDCEALKSISLGSISDGMIHEQAFYNCQSLVSIVIPEGVTKIERSAFEACVSLKEFILPSTLIGIESQSFKGCESVKNITIPDSVLSIGFGAFEDCLSVESYTAPFIGSGRSPYNAYMAYVFGSYGNMATMQYRSTLKTVVITDTYAIGNGALFGCKALASLTLPDTLQTIGNSAFSGCTALEAVTLPKGLVSIGSDAFYGCTAIKSLKIPAGVTQLPSNLFNTCTSLSTVEIEGEIAGIGSYAFLGCQSLRDFIIPETVKSIGEYAFYACTNMTDIRLPVGLESIGLNAFGGIEVTSITLPFIGSSPKSTENRHFGYIFGAINTAENSTKLPETLKSVTVNGTSSIPDYAFAGCTKLESIILPEGITSIGNNAFSTCTSLKEISIPKSVLSIGSYAFENCSAFKSAVLPSGLKSIGYGAFYGCSALEEITLPFVGDTSENPSDTKLGHIFAVPSGYSQSGHIPSSLKRVTVTNTTSIGVNAFSECGNIETVILPSSLQTIGNAAFNACTSIVNISLPDSLTSIGHNAFNSCTALSSITIPEKVTQIGNYAFKNCTNLSFVNFNAVNCMDISNTSGAFSNAGTGSGGIVLTVGPLVERIPGYLFSSYQGFNTVPVNIISVSFGESSVCKEIGAYAFYRVDSLSSIVFPRTLTAIGSYAFYYCQGLDSVFIPLSVETIAIYAFYNTNAVISCEAESKPAGWNSYWTSSGKAVFWNCNTEINYSFVTGTEEELSDIKSKGAIVLPTPTREGYAFLGWYDNASFTGNVYNGAFYRNADVTLYARWGSSETAGTSFSDAIPLGYAENLTVNIIRSGAKVYLVFTPTAGGSYTFKSVSNVDTYGRLYNADGSLVSSNDGASDFSITSTLTANQTYYLEVSFYSSTRIGSFDVRVD